MPFHVFVENEIRSKNVRRLWLRPGSPTLTIYINESRRSWADEQIRAPFQEKKWLFELLYDGTIQTSKPQADQRGTVRGTTSSVGIVSLTCWDGWQIRQTTCIRRLRRIGPHRAVETVQTSPIQTIIRWCCLLRRCKLNVFVVAWSGSGTEVKVTLIG